MARLHLSFESGFDGSTILRVKEQQPPWRVIRGFPTASGETLAHLHNVSGGILDGDALECRIDVGARALGQLTSTGATRVYRSRLSGRTASQHMTVNIGECGYFEYLPDALIPFADSRFEQSTHIALAAGASLIWWDVVAPGRAAAGEVFGYDSLACTFQLTAAGEPIATERWAIEPRLHPPDTPARLGPFRHFATCYVCRAGEPASYWRAFESELQNVAGRLSNPELLWGVSSLRAHGLVLRGVAVSGRPLLDGLVELWKAAKWHLCGRVATLPRKVH
jgi:urease accessory protein